MRGVGPGGSIATVNLVQRRAWLGRPARSPTRRWLVTAAFAIGAAALATAVGAVAFLLGWVSGLPIGR